MADQKGMGGGGAGEDGIGGCITVSYHGRFADDVDVSAVEGCCEADYKFSTVIYGCFGGDGVYWTVGVDNLTSFKAIKPGKGGGGSGGGCTSVSNGCGGARGRGFCGDRSVSEAKQECFGGVDGVHVSGSSNRHEDVGCRGFGTVICDVEGCGGGEPWGGKFNLRSGANVTSDGSCSANDENCCREVGGNVGW